MIVHKLTTKKNLEYVLSIRKLNISHIVVLTFFFSFLLLRFKLNSLSASFVA